MKIPGKMIERKPKPTEGKVYTIKSVEFRETSNGKGFRVVLSDTKGNEYEDMLWLNKSDEYGPKSKLGAFVTVLGDDTDDWIGKKIKIISWTPKNNEISLVE